MNCFRYSVPLSPELHQFSDSLPDSQRIPCREILTAAVQQLLEPGIAQRAVQKWVGTIHSVLDLLSQDERVQRSLGEYYGLRLLVTEFESALEHFESDQDRSRFQRVASKLIRELNQPSPSSEATGFDQITGPALVHAAN